MYHPHWTEKTARTRLMLIASLLWFFVGCTDGPFFELKKLNPIIQRQWQEDRERGPVFSQRVEEMRLLGNQIRRMPENEQSRWVSTISSIVETETSPELRREAVLTLTEVISRPEASTTIIKLARDKNDKVRLEAAGSLKNFVSPETTQTLLAMATNDADENVRLRAIESLGAHRTDEVKQFLQKSLNDPHPDVQYSTALALKDYTGKDFKGDVPAWKQFLAGDPVEPKTPSLAETLQSYVPFRR